MAAMETEHKPDNSEELNTEEESKTQEQPDYPSFEGPGAKYVKLISSDKIEYILEKKYAQVSATLKKRLSETGRIILIINGKEVYNIKADRSKNYFTPCHHNTPLSLLSGRGSELD